jgi:phosphoribosylformylglycinamidine synthase
MFNQATIYDKDGNVVKRGVFPTLLMTTMAKIDDVSEIVTIDAKEEGDLVYVVGAVTKKDMGGSEYYNMYSEKAGKEFNIGNVSDEDVSSVFDTFKKMNKARRLMQSAKYVEAGGLMTAVRDTAMAGEIGIEFDADKVNSKGKMLLNELLYSETEGRFLVTVKYEDRREFERIFEGKYSRIGEVKGDSLVMKKGGKEILNENVDNLLSIYHKTEDTEERRAA